MKFEFKVSFEVTRNRKPDSTMTITELTDMYAEAYDSGNRRRMGAINAVLHSMGADCYVKDGKIQLLTYNGCERKEVR